MQLLPNIRFCDDAEAALSTAQQHDQAFSWMRRCLFELNDCCRRWSGGPFPHEELRCKPTPESESISNNPELRRLRTFVCPDGAKRYFQWHLKNFGRNLRLHYFPMKRKELSLSAISADICRRDCTERNQLHVRFNLWVLRFKDRATRAVALRTCTSAAEMVCICAEPQASGLVLIVDRPAFRQPPHCRVAGD